MKTERELFEDWCHINDEFCTHRYTDNCQEYSDDYTQSAWLAWQSRVPEGYAVVPKEPSSEIIVAIESKVEDQLKASAIEADPFRLDGETIYEAMIEASEK